MEQASEMPAGGEGDGGKRRKLLPFFDHILENVLEKVLCFLTSRRDRNAASLVCKSWYRAEALTRIELFIGNCCAVSPSRAIDRFRRVRSLVLKGRPRFAGLHVPPLGWWPRFTPWLTSMAPAYPCLEQICLKRVTVDDDDLLLLARSFPSFRHLSLIFCSGFSTAGLAIIAGNCRNLRSLDLIETDVNDSYIEGAMEDWVSMFPPGNTCLESLVFDLVGHLVNFEALASLVARSPFLWRLRVNLHISLSHLSRLMVLAPQLTDLGACSFSAASEVDEDVESVFHAFESLSCLSGFIGIAPEYPHTIHPVCAHLTSLNFSNAPISPQQFNPIITRCPNLETLRILDSVGDKGLQMVAASCRKLKKLAVYPHEILENSEAYVSNLGLVAISSGCQSLRSITYFCCRMTSSAVVTMSKKCQELEVFRLFILGPHRRPDHLTKKPMDEGFGAIVKNCKNLTRLSVSGFLTGKAFTYIGRYGKLLRTLSVIIEENSNPNFNLRDLLQGCSRLRKLEILNCPFGDVGLLSGINHYYNLRFLRICYCGLSLNGCEEVARALPRMVVEVIEDSTVVENDSSVTDLYMYRSLVGPTNDGIGIRLLGGFEAISPFYSAETFSLDLML